MVPSVAWASRTVSAIVGMKRASTNSCQPHADGELVSVAMVRRQHAAGTQEAYRTAPIVDNRTQSTSLSAIIDKRRYGSTTPGPSSVLLPHGVRKACRRLRETGGADPWCGPGLTTSVVLLSILEYYAYSISPGQAAAHGGHAMLSGGHVVLLNVHVPMTHATSPYEFEIKSHASTRLY